MSKKLFFFITIIFLPNHTIMGNTSIGKSLKIASGATLCSLGARVAYVNAKERRKEDMFNWLGETITNSLIATLGNRDSLVRRTFLIKKTTGDLNGQMERLGFTIASGMLSKKFGIGSTVLGAYLLYKSLTSGPKKEAPIDKIS